MKRNSSNQKIFVGLFLCFCTFLPKLLHAFEDDGTWENGYFYNIGTFFYGPTKEILCSRTPHHKYVHGNYCAVYSDPDNPGSRQWIGKYTCYSGSGNPRMSGQYWVDSGCGTVPKSSEMTISRAHGATGHCDQAGNPISISTGNKFQQEVILNRPLPLTLSYNSLDQQWRHSYAYALETSDSTATLIRPDGKGLGFTEAIGVWTADDGDVFYTLSAFDNGSGSAWKVTTQSGSEELYDDQGRILSISNLQGQSLNFTHTDSTTEVSDEFDDVLLLTLDANNQLSAIALNGVTQTTLTYDSEERLISRTDAQNNTVQYHYEDTNFPNHLTGITGADGQRFATWAYDTEGRGILSEHAGQETAQLLFNEDGSTTVTNSLGKQTTYHYEEIEGLKRPVQIEGHASENCVAANQAYTYNANGLVETQTDWSGTVTRFEYNDRGLVTRKTIAEGTPDERVADQVWHESLPLLLQTHSAGRTVRYQYDLDNRLIKQYEVNAL